MIYIYSLIVFVSATLILFRSVGYIQLDGYSISRRSKVFREWGVFGFVFFVNVLLLGVNALIDHFVNADISKLFLVLVSVFSVVFLILSLNRKWKTHPRFTKRFVRLYLTATLFLFLTTGILLLISTQFIIIYHKLAFFSLLYVLSPILLMLSLYATLPIEKAISNKYIKRAKQKLASMPQVKVIGITGSYAKTTVKNILYTILSVKYNVYMTPKSFNTPLGLSMSIDRLTGEEDYFIAEMGARHVGDIKELVDIVRPSYGIITGVAKQHIETFHSFENVERTKYELIKGLPEEGFAVFNGFDETAKRMYNYTNNTVVYFTDSEYANISDIEMSDSGAKFTLELFGESVRCFSKLIGKHNLINILLASLTAYKLGVGINDIKFGIEMLESIPHRLEVVRSANGITILDDSFNSNVRGFEVALETMTLFSGKKVVMTPGIVEGGKDEKSINIEVGKLIAKYADNVILIGSRAKYIEIGLKDADFCMENVVKVHTLDAAKTYFPKLLAVGDVLLIENDLPDNY